MVHTIDSNYVIRDQVCVLCYIQSSLLIPPLCSPPPPSIPPLIFKSQIGFDRLYIWLPIPPFSEYRRFFASPKNGGIEGFDCTLFVKTIKQLCFDLKYQIYSTKYLHIQLKHNRVRKISQSIYIKSHTNNSFNTPTCWWSLLSRILQSILTFYSV